MKIIPPGVTFEQALRAGYCGKIECAGYLDWLRELPCDGCGAAPPSQASHLNSIKGMGTKSTDLLAIPECAECHETYERRGSPDYQRRCARAVFYLIRAFWEGRLRWTSR